MFRVIYIFVSHEYCGVELTVSSQVIYFAMSPD